MANGLFAFGLNQLSKFTMGRRLIASLSLYTFFHIFIWLFGGSIMF
jgi:hypothetical protein